MGDFLESRAMSKPVRKGYCRDCQANVKHVRRFRSALTRSFDKLTFRFMARFRLGSWHCLQCTRNTIYLALPRADVRTIHIGRAEQPKSEETQVESAGNFLRNEHSLVAKKQRLSRYSPKYREGVVHKILSGHVTVAEMCRELELSETDLMEWFAAVFDEQAIKIKQLSSLIEALGENGMIQRISAEDEFDHNVIDSKSAGKSIH